MEHGQSVAVGDLGCFWRGDGDRAYAAPGPDEDSRLCLCLRDLDDGHDGRLARRLQLDTDRWRFDIYGFGYGAGLGQISQADPRRTILDHDDLLCRASIDLPRVPLSSDGELQRQLILKPSPIARRMSRNGKL